MVRKLFRISQGFLAGILIYFAFISILYFRMKNTEKMLADYYDARSCQSSSNCREMIKAKISDYGSKKVSFTNYGPRGIPLESGTFEEYVFTISMENSETETVKVLPYIPSDTSAFDIANIYIPNQSDETMANSSLLDEKSVSVETWHGRITLIFMSALVREGNQTNESPQQEAASIGPLEQELYEFVLATENHPVIRAELARKDFNGWTGGILLGAISVSVFGGAIMGFFYGIDWIFRKVFSRKDVRRKSKKLLNEMTS